VRQAQILVVDDEAAFRDVLCEVLVKKGHTVRSGGTAAEALLQLEKGNFDLTICDLRLPDMSGLDLLRKCRETTPRMHFIMISAYGDIETAVEAVKLGADDYLTKPFLFDDILLRIERLLEHVTLQRSHEALQEELGARYESRGVVGQSPSMQNVRDLIHRVAATNSNVLILGESGTGKEVVARTIHRVSDRKDRRLVSVNCAALPDTLLESELFGYAKGAFTGAARDKEGFFTAADGGTLFLDEIGAMPLPLQSKLLRAIESKEISPIGSSALPTKVDVRILSATSADPAEAIRSERLMDALYYRLNVVEIHLPPLRERKQDVPMLVDHFVRQLSEELKKRVSGVDEEAIAMLMAYDWPGNVRELENAIERAMILTDGDRITAAALPLSLQRSRRPRGETPLNLRAMLDQCESEHVAAVLALTNDDKVKAAQMLGVSVSSLYRKLEKAKSAIAAADQSVA
jgi:DNA-binding NtrC family response regulator